MNKKEYIKPNSKHIVIACASIIAASPEVVDQELVLGTEGDGNAEGKFSLWEDED